MTSIMFEQKTSTANMRRPNGDLLQPKTPGVDDARALWNTTHDHRPTVTIRPGFVLDVQRAVAFAQEQELPLLKHDGNDAVGHGGVLLDMSRMRDVSVDPTARTVRVQGGATWADVARETTPFGLAAAGGMSSTSSVADLVVDGGAGWLVSSHGLAIDNLRAVELVAASGEFLTASRDEHPELFWALRGGRDDLGVATCFTFDLHPVDLVLAGMVAFPIEQARDVLRFYRNLTETAPHGLTADCWLMSDPELDTRVIAISVCWSGDLRAGERVLEPLMKVGSPLLRMVGPMPYVEWQGAHDSLLRDGARSSLTSVKLPRLEEGVLDALLERAANPALPGLAATIACHAGPMTRAPLDATAYPHRDAPYGVAASGSWDSLSDMEAGRAWVEEMQTLLAPYAKPGSLLTVDNAPESASNRGQGWFGANWDRLLSVKRRYDPGNVFRGHIINPD